MENAVAVLDTFFVEKAHAHAALCSTSSDRLCTCISAPMSFEILDGLKLSTGRTNILRISRLLELLQKLELCTSA